MPHYATKEKSSKGCNKKIIDHNYLRYTHIFFSNQNIASKYVTSNTKKPKKI